MKKENLTTKIVLLLAFICVFAACGQKKFSISVNPQNGSPGDIVIINVANAKANKDAEVKIGADQVPVIEATDSSITVMVPPASPQATKISVTLDKQNSEAPFQVDKTGAIRLWFSLKDNNIRFTESQVSNQDFEQDNSFSLNKIMYEITDDRGENIVVGYINNPLQLEVPSADGKGFSNIDLQGEVNFSINVPAFANMNNVRFTTISSSDSYKGKLLSEVSLKGYLK